MEWFYLKVLNVLNIAVLKHTHNITICARFYWVAYGCLLRWECSGCAANGFLINTRRGYCFKLKRNRSADCTYIRVAYWIALQFYFIFNEWAEEYHSHYHLLLVPFLFCLLARTGYGTQRTDFFFKYKLTALISWVSLSLSYFFCSLSEWGGAPKKNITREIRSMQFNRYIIWSLRCVR